MAKPPSRPGGREIKVGAHKGCNRPPCYGTGAGKKAPAPKKDKK